MDWDESLALFPINNNQGTATTLSYTALNVLGKTKQLPIKHVLILLIMILCFIENRFGI